MGHLAIVALTPDSAEELRRRDTSDPLPDVVRPQFFGSWSATRTGGPGAGAAAYGRGMSSDQPDPYATHPEESVFPAAGERVSDEDRQRALDADPDCSLALAIDGNATVGDTVDTDDLDSSAHEEGPGSQEVAEQARD